MYCILVYDCGEKRVGKMLKHCRKYMNWIQNSVFEGELSQVQIDKMLHGAKKIMVEEEYSVIIFTSRNAKWLDKKVIGVDKASTDNFF